jgi:hypothetical protein
MMIIAFCFNVLSIMKMKAIMLDEGWGAQL